MFIAINILQCPVTILIGLIVPRKLIFKKYLKIYKDNTKHGWWEEFIGTKCAIDTEKFFVICCNHLGSCFGSTGPSSVNPVTNKQYASTFPIITIYDMINVQFMLLDHLGIKKVHRLHSFYTLMVNSI